MSGGGEILPSSQKTPIRQSFPAPKSQLTAPTPRLAFAGTFALLPSDCSFGATDALSRTPLSRFSPVHRADPEGQQRVGLTRWLNRRRTMGWTAPRTASACQDGRCQNPSEGKPSKGKSIRNLSTVTQVGLDLKKRVFQVHAVEAKGEIVVARKLTRSQLIPFFAELPPCVVAMEACSSAHHWGRALMELGHEVRLNPPAHVKPYVRRNKSDQVDSAAIYEAMSRPGQRFVPVRSIDNQAELMHHRARELLAGQCTAALNALRGHLAEIGLIAPQGA
jgi:Transposase